MLILVTILLLSSAFFVALAYSVGRRFGFHKWVLLCGHLLIFAPWLTHYSMFLLMANVDDLPYQVLAVPLLVLLLIALVTLINLPGLRAVNILVPGVSFMATYFYVMPSIYSTAQDYKFDNIPTIWLLVWTIGATLALIVYSGLSLIPNATKAH